MPDLASLAEEGTQMLVPMPPTDAMFLLAESREHPMHVGSLQLFRPPDGADAMDVRAMFDEAIATGAVAPAYLRRPRRGVTSLAQWGWETDHEFDIEHHVRRNSLPYPGRVLDLLALCSRLHSSLLDRNRPLWEAHLIEGLDDGRYAVYIKVHHAVTDGVSAIAQLQRTLSLDPDARGLPAMWAPPRELPPGPPRDRTREAGAELPAQHRSGGVLRTARGVGTDLLGGGPALVRVLLNSLREQGSPVSFAAPRTMFNVPITGARRFAAQSWPLERIRRVGRSADATVNDVVLAMCGGALRSYLLEHGALPDSTLIAMVPVSLRRAGDTGRGNSVGLVMCNLGTDLSDAGSRLAVVTHSMNEGKQLISGMTPLQILIMSALGIAPLGLNLVRLGGRTRPPFNLVISNVPGPTEPMYWNGARLDGLYPLSIPLDGQALNITVTSYSDELAFGLTGCRRTVPHLQRLLGYLDDELAALEKAVGGE